MGLLLTIALVWGVLEATIFFIIPDVIVTYIGLKGYKAATYAAIASLFGALLGGVIMYVLGIYQFEVIAGFVEKVPAINETMMEEVKGSLQNEGLIAMILGPTKGIPYKIYAIYANQLGIGFISFILASIPARFIRFYLTGLLAAFFSVTVLPKLAKKAKVFIWLIVWIIVYVIYFSVHPF